MSVRNRYGARTSPTSRCGVDSFTWWRSWTGRAGGCWLGGCVTRWTPPLRCRSSRWTAAKLSGRSPNLPDRSGSTPSDPHSADDRNTARRTPAAPAPDPAARSSRGRRAAAHRTGPHRPVRSCSSPAILRVSPDDGSITASRALSRFTGWKNEMPLNRLLDGACAICATMGPQHAE